jgi:hypothetical protein
MFNGLTATLVVQTVLGIIVICMQRRHPFLCIAWAYEELFDAFPTR